MSESYRTPHACLIWVLATVAACRGTTREHAPPRTIAPVTEVAATASSPPPAPPPASVPAPCDPAVPAAACARRSGLTVCAGDAADRVGEWRYAVIAPAYTAAEDLSAAALTAAWQHGELAATAETAAAVAALLGPGAPQLLERGSLPLEDPHRPRPGHKPAPAASFAIIPADQLVPAWKVITVDGHHPLDTEPRGLAVPLCARRAPSSDAPVTAAPPVRNIDPAQLTTVAITGVTALTRLTAELIDRKGPEYPVKDVAPWLAAADFVHISHEVSFVTKDCQPYKSLITEFCARDSYIKVLEAAHASIIELTGSHLPDYGRSWIDHTLELYRERGWVWFGGGHDQLEGTAPRIVEHHGNKLAFLGCNMHWTTSHVITEGPGVAACDLDRMRWQIGELSRAHVVPIVSIQHEEVYHHEVPDELVRDFRSLAAAGAAVVNGSQAHSAHPWEFHRGAYIHYGGGNFLFDQQASNTQDATADRLYIHANRLLTVSHLYTRLEEFGRPRPMTPRERTGYLAVMASARDKLPAADPWTAPAIAPPSRSHPDSFLVGKQLAHITVTLPAMVEPDRRYPLIIDLAAGPAHPGPGDDAAYIVTPARSSVASAGLTAALTRFMTAKYPVDSAHVAIRHTAAPATAASR